MALRYFCTGSDGQQRRMPAQRKSILPKVVTRADRLFDPHGKFRKYLGDEGVTS